MSDIGYKVVMRQRGSKNHKSLKGIAILKIQILGKEIRPFSGEKYRTDKIKVLEARSLGRKLLKQKEFYPLVGNVFSWIHNKGSTKEYVVGETYTENLDTNTFEVCGEGIHYFKDKKILTYFILRYWTDLFRCEFLENDVSVRLSTFLNAIRERESKEKTWNQL